jgi:hypothetical protein
MKQYIIFYTVEHALKIEAADLPTAESRARILVAQQGPRTKVLAIREMDKPGDFIQVPDPGRSAKLRQGRVKMPEFPDRDP